MTTSTTSTPPLSDQAARHVELDRLRGALISVRAQVADLHRQASVDRRKRTALLATLDAARADAILDGTEVADSEIVQQIQKIDERVGVEPQWIAGRQVRGRPGSLELAAARLAKAEQDAVDELAAWRELFRSEFDEDWRLGAGATARDARKALAVAIQNVLAADVDSAAVRKDVWSGAQSTPDLVGDRTVDAAAVLADVQHPSGRDIVPVNTLLGAIEVWCRTIEDSESGYLTYVSERGEGEK